MSNSIKGTLRALQDLIVGTWRATAVESSHWQLDDYGILNKLLFNEVIPGSPEGILRILGFVHHYTASGIHLYSFLIALDWLCYRVAFFFPALHADRVQTIKWLQRWAGVGCLFYLWSLQDYRIGFARPMMTFLIRSFARHHGARWRLWLPLTFTAIFDLCFQIESGRMHYYLAVGGGLWALDQYRAYCEKNQKKSNHWLEHLAMALGSWVWIAAVDLSHFKIITWMTPVWSMLTLPVISMLLFPVTVFSLLIFGIVPQWVISLWNRLMEGCLMLIENGGTYSVVSEKAIWLGLAFSLCTVVAFYLAKRLRLKPLSQFGLWVLILFLSVGIRWSGFLENRKTQIVQLNVSQGAALLVKRGGRTEMVDVGSKRVKKRHRWLLRLAELEINHLDLILLTHLDEDHSGALVHLAGLLPIDQVETHPTHWKSSKGVKLKKQLQQFDPSIVISSKQSSPLMKVAWFKSKRKRHSGNDLMAGLVIPLDQHHAYFALGDGDFSQEKQYLRRFYQEIRSTPKRIWKVGHHGSRYSSDAQFLAHFQASEYWISVGKWNRYGHPHPDTLLRLRRSPVRIRRTDQEGDLVYSNE